VWVSRQTEAECTMDGVAAEWWKRGLGGLATSSHVLREATGGVEGCAAGCRGGGENHGGNEGGGWHKSERSGNGKERVEG